MKLNKEFKEENLIKKSELEDFKINHGDIIPTDYQKFLTQIGGEKFSSKGEISFCKDRLKPNFIFYNFYSLDDIKSQIDIINFKSDKFTNIPLNKYFWIGEGSMQNYIAIGNSKENRNQIFWYEDQELKVHFVCNKLETFINEYLIEINSSNMEI